MRRYSQLHMKALCQGHEEELFPRNGRPSAYVKKNLCPTCPVRDACLQWALESPWKPEGMWAGLDQAEVQAMWLSAHPGARADVNKAVGL